MLPRGPVTQASTGLTAGSLGVQPTRRAISRTHVTLPTAVSLTPTGGWLPFAATGAGWHTAVVTPLGIRLAHTRRTRPLLASTWAAFATADLAGDLPAPLLPHSRRRLALSRAWAWGRAAPVTGTADLTGTSPLLLPLTALAHLATSRRRPTLAGGARRYAAFAPRLAGPASTT